MSKKLHACIEKLRKVFIAHSTYKYILPKYPKNVNVFSLFL